MAGQLHSSIGVQSSDNVSLHSGGFGCKLSFLSKYRDIQATQQQYKYSEHQVRGGSGRRNVAAQWPGNILRKTDNHQGSYLSPHSFRGEGQLREEMVQSRLHLTEAQTDHQLRCFVGGQGAVRLCTSLVPIDLDAFFPPRVVEAETASGLKAGRSGRRA